jgi:hypothetical protein
MGVYTDLIAAAKSWDASADTVARGRVVTKQIEVFRERQGDPEYPAGFAAVDEVQLIDPLAGSGQYGTFTLTFDLVGYDSFTTDPINLNSALSVWDTEIYDAAQAAGVPVESGDIHATGNRLKDGSAIITYTGDVVGAKAHELVSINLSNVTIMPYPASYTVQEGGGGSSEVQRIEQFLPGVTGGFYYYYFFLVDPVYPQSTGPIAHDAGWSDQRNATNNALFGYPGYSSDDVGINLDGTSLVNGGNNLTYFGSSVANKNHQLASVTGDNLTGTWDKGADVSRVAGGSPNRTALAAVEVMSLADSPPPPQGTSSGIAAITTRNNNPQFPSQETLQALAYQAAIDDGSDQLYVDLMTEFGLSHLL